MVPVCPPSLPCRRCAWGPCQIPTCHPHSMSDPDLPQAQRTQQGTESCSDTVWEEVEIEASRGWAGPY